MFCEEVIFLCPSMKTPVNKWFVLSFSQNSFTVNFTFQTILIQKLDFAFQDVKWNSQLYLKLNLFPPQQGSVSGQKSSPAILFFISPLHWIPSPQAHTPAFFHLFSVFLI